MRFGQSLFGLLVGQQYDSLLQITMIQSADFNAFPSFAPSPSASPRALRLLENDNQSQVHKITINLPESFVESTIEQHRSISSSMQMQDSKPDSENIKVYCRFKPGLSPSIIKYDETMIDDGENRYSFNSIFGKYATQQDVFDSVGWRHVDSFFRGQNSTLFTYGQTGSGKTFTMFGNLKERQGYGIIPRTLQMIFQRKPSDDSITCSILQIYNQKLIDLFDPLKQSAQGLKLKQINDSVILQGLVEVQVQNHHQVMDLIRFGYKDRKIASTYNNDCSSRSHTILFVYRTRKCLDKQYRTKLCFIDLAGSEKIRKSGVKGHHLEETKKINLSLSCLGNVVSALTSSAEHIPYRNSKLTRILKDSLTGLCKTSIITTCSLQKADYHETISTVKFAVRAKKIRNKKRLTNQEITPQEVIATLKKQLANTKKQLEYYKRMSEVDVTQTEQIPEEEVECRPIKLSSCIGVGISSRVHSSSVSD